MVDIVTEVAWAASGIYVASPVEEYFELCHAESGGLSEEEQKLTHLITRAPPFYLQPIILLPYNLQSHIKPSVRCSPGLKLPIHVYGCKGYLTVNAYKEQLGTCFLDCSVNCCLVSCALWAAQHASKTV